MTRYILLIFAAFWVVGAAGKEARKSLVEAVLNAAY